MAEDKRNLSRHHADYDATADSRQKSRDFYEGNDVLKAKKTEYLRQGRNEKDNNYAERLWRAVYDPDRYDFGNRIAIARESINERLRTILNRCKSAIHDSKGRD